MSKLNMMSFSDGFDIRETLCYLDSKLNSHEQILLCGSCVPILAGYSFRHTSDIDFAIMPSAQIVTVIRSDIRLASHFDFQAQGVVGLLIDCEDRSVNVDLGLKYLIVRRLSIRDWIVSKLASPKLEDVLNLEGVTREDLNWVESKMVDYGGVSWDRAMADLKYLQANINL